MINDVRRLRPDNIVKVKENGRWVTARVVAVMPTFIIAKNPYRQIGNTYDIARKEVHGARISDEWLCSFGWQKIKSEFGDTEDLKVEFEP